MTNEQRARLEAVVRGLKPALVDVAAADDLRAALAHIDALAAEVAELMSERLELMQAFGAISRAVATIDGESDNTPWQDVVERIARTGRRLELSRALHTMAAKEVLALREALDRHGVHDETCAKRRSFTTLFPGALKRCDCGLDAALTPTKEEA